MTKIKSTLAIVSIFLASIFIYSCSKNNDIDLVSQNLEKTNPVLEKFLNSATYERAKKTISAYGEIDKKAITIDSTIIDNKIVFHYFTVIIKKNNKINATLDVVNLNDTKNLPYGDTYALNLNDMSDFDTETKSGKIKLFDLNYDNFLHSVFTINNNSIKERIYNRPSVEYLSKFKSIQIDKNKVAQQASRISNGARAIPCDSNGNGNLGFFECYSCFKSASEIPGTFGSWWCDVPVAGWASCWSSMSAACAILSSIY